MTNVAGMQTWVSLLIICDLSFPQNAVKRCYSCSGGCDGDVVIEDCPAGPEDKSEYLCFNAKLRSKEDKKFEILKMCILADINYTLVLCDAIDKTPGGYCIACYEDLCNSTRSCKLSMLYLLYLYYLIASIV